MTPLVCLYCFASSQRRALEFRCAGRVVGRTGGCEPVNDAVHAQFRGVPTYVAPPVFAADGRQARAVHPVCGQLSLRRVCPSCHSELPMVPPIARTRAASAAAVTGLTLAMV